MKKWAFTLAETLLTLAIIGVIAAITMPALNANIVDRQLEAGTLRAYNLMQNAISKYMVDNDIEGELIQNQTLFGAENVDNFVKNYFKINMKCDNITGCFASKYTMLDSNTAVDSSIVFNNAAAYQLNNGMALQFDGEDITIDVNGKKGPNALNKDLWLFEVRDDGSVVDPVARPGEYSNEELAEFFATCKSANPAIAAAHYGCFANFLNNGFKFDY